MKQKMPVIAAVFGLLLAIVYVGQSQIITPVLADGKYLGPSEAPCVPYHIGQSSNTATVFTVDGVGYLSWVMLSTAAADGTVYAAIFDTAKLGNATGSEVMRVVPNSATQGTFLEFKPPFRFTKGLGVANSVASSWGTFCARSYATQNP